MHRESRIYRQIGHFVMPSSGNLVTKNKQLSRAVDLLSQASEEIDRLTAELAAVKEESAETCRKLLEYNHRLEAVNAELQTKLDAGEEE
jgi:methyl-accepting chemotaxis protein